MKAGKDTRTKIRYIITSPLYANEVLKLLYFFRLQVLQRLGRKILLNELLWRKKLHEFED